MAAKKTYIVADGCAFTGGGVMYAAGSEITAEAFADEKAFNAFVKSGSIVEKKDDGGEKEPEAAEKAADKGEEKPKEGKSK